MPQGGELTLSMDNMTLSQEIKSQSADIPPGCYVVLAVADTGTGIPPEVLPQIFEPFFSTKGPKGTGLGLSMVYGIIKQSGGYIWAQSEPGKGTTFKVYLPRVSETGELAVMKPTVAAKEVQQGRETVLLVEDEVTVLRLAREYLELQGYTVIDAGDPATAILISNAHAGPIHLLLTDVVMPGMTGRELANHLSPRRPEMRVLYMSGYTENAIGRNGTLDEGITLLQKPFTLLTLKAKVREVLDSPLPKEVEAGRPVAKLSPYRAQRFNLQLPIKYRPLGENDWRAGTTENISRSGLLFRAEEMLPANIQLEINLVLPAEIAGLSAAEVVCRGEVVRTMEAETPSMNPALAAKILQYHFQHGSHVPEA